MMIIGVYALSFIAAVSASAYHDMRDFQAKYTFPLKVGGNLVNVRPGGNFRATIRKPLLSDSTASLADIRQLSKPYPDDISGYDYAQPSIPVANAYPGSYAPVAYAAPAYAHAAPAPASYNAYPAQNGYVTPGAPVPASLPFKRVPGHSIASVVAQPKSTLRATSGPSQSASASEDGTQAYKYNLGYGFAQKTKYLLDGVGAVKNREYSNSAGQEAGYDQSAQRLPITSYLRT